MRDWKQYAACAGMDPGLFYAKSNTHEGQAALKICSSCPVANECLKYALEFEYWAGGKPAGIYGGFTPTQRNAMRVAARSRKCRRHLHEMTGDNVVTNGQGKRMCRACARERKQRKRKTA